MGKDSPFHMFGNECLRWNDHQWRRPSVVNHSTFKCRDSSKEMLIGDVNRIQLVALLTISPDIEKHYFMHGASQLSKPTWSPIEIYVKADSEGRHIKSLLYFYGIKCSLTSYGRIETMFWSLRFSFVQVK